MDYCLLSDEEWDIIKNLPSYKNAKLIYDSPSKPDEFTKKLVKLMKVVQERNKETRGQSRES